MSVQITTAFVKQFQGNLDFLVQQKGSKLRNAVREESLHGEDKFFERIGATEATEITTRHGDSPLINTPHDRRKVSPRFFDWGDLIDDADKIRTLIDPENAYAQNAAYALGRKADDLIIEAAFGTAYSGKAGTTSVTFPAGQQIAVNFGGGGNVGLTIKKLIETRRLFQANNVDLEDPSNALHLAMGAKQLADLLNTTEVTSADYNSVKALVKGEINTFLGFTFHFTERLSTDTSSYRRVIAWAKSGLLLGVGKDIETRVTERADKRFSTYVYAKASYGATRMEEEKVVEIKCSEA